MRFEVLLTENPALDLDEIHDYLTAHDSSAKADYVAERLEKIMREVAARPDRGSHPEELFALGIHEYRQTLLKPYGIMDGRRDMQSLLARRLLHR